MAGSDSESEWTSERGDRSSDSEEDDTRTLGEIRSERRPKIEREMCILFGFFFPLDSEFCCPSRNFLGAPFYFFFFTLRATKHIVNGFYYIYSLFPLHPQYNNYRLSVAGICIIIYVSLLFVDSNEYTGALFFWLLFAV